MAEKINHYRVSIRGGSKYLNENKFEKNEYEIIAENKSYIALNDWCFTSIKKVKDNYGSCLDKESISVFVNDSIWGSGVSYSLYTFKKVKASTIKKHIENAVNEKLGFFMNGLDLEIIKD